MAAPQTELVTGEITYDGDALGYATDGDALNLAYGDFQCWNQFDSGRLTFAGSNTSPTAFGGAVTSVVRLGAPRVIWTCEWTACRMGAEPDVPDPESPPAGWTLLDANLTNAAAGIGPDGVSPIYRVSGVYSYVKGVPATGGPFAEAFYPRRPETRENAFKRFTSAARLRRDLAAPGTGSSSSAGPAFAVQG
jgi:hypothetical protein